MYKQVEKSKESKSRAVASSVFQKNSKVKQGVGFFGKQLVEKSSSE